MSKKRNCMRCGTGLSPRNEKWAEHDTPCGKCDAYLQREEHDE